MGSDPVGTHAFSPLRRITVSLPRVCRPYRPDTKGKAEFSPSVSLKGDFWAGISFGSLTDLNPARRRPSMK